MKSPYLGSGALVRAVCAVLDPVAEAGHENTARCQGSCARSADIAGPYSADLGADGRSLWACWLQRLSGQLLTEGEGGWDWGFRHLQF